MRFFKTFQIVKCGYKGGVTYCASCINLYVYVPTFRYHLKHKKISRNAVNSTERGRLTQNLKKGFFKNFPDSKMVMRVKYCASLDEFICAKFETSLQTQEVQCRVLWRRLL